MYSTTTGVRGTRIRVIRVFFLNHMQPRKRTLQPIEYIHRTVYGWGDNQQTLSKPAHLPAALAAFQSYVSMCHIFASDFL